MKINTILNLIGPYVKYGLIVLITFIMAAVLSKIIKRLLQTYFEANSKKLKNDPTSYKFVKNAIGFFIYLIAIVLMFYIIPGLKALGLTLLASAGIFTAVLAMASSQAFSNIISGIFIVIFKPFRVDDRIKIADKYIGIVEDITLRHTVIKDFENQRIIIPNSIISSETVVNVSIIDETVCNFLEIPIPYDSDIDKVKKIIKDNALKHPNFIDIRTNKEKENGTEILPVIVIGFSGSLINLRTTIWTKNAANGFALKCELREIIIKCLRKLDISIAVQTQELLIQTNNINSQIN